MYKFTNITSIYLLIFYHNGIIKFIFGLLFLNNILMYMCGVMPVDKTYIVYCCYLISFIIVNFSLCLGINKVDLADGWIECLLSTTLGLHICIGKFLALLVMNTVILTIMLPLMHLLYNLELSLYMVITLYLVALSTTALLVLLSAMQNYFNRSGYVLSLLVLPLVLPIAVLATSWDTSIQIIAVLFGINLILTPLLITTSSYLSNNLYNF